MKVIKPTDQFNIDLIDSPSVFLAGSIEMGAAEDWQNAIPMLFEDSNTIFFNPRRDEWDASWKQEQKSLQFNQQVNWEMNMLERCDIIFMYFSPETKSPISLLELGAYGSSGKMIVCCPDGFWRRGNVEIFCTRHDIPFFGTLSDAVGALRTKLWMRS